MCDLLDLFRCLPISQLFASLILKNHEFYSHKIKGTSLMQSNILTKINSLVNKSYACKEADTFKLYLAI